jgi:DNA-binding transcriptional MerR regulator
MSELASRLEPYKLRSRRYRKQALKALETGDLAQAAQDFERSRQAIREALDYLEDLGAPDLRTPEPASEGDAEIAKQLADCWGVLGGIYRAEGDDQLRHAKQAYDTGFTYEGCKRFNLPSSYNRVNRLVVRILETPGLLVEPLPLVMDVSEAERKTMPALLAEAEEEIDRQLRNRLREDDRAWAYADLAMVRLLGGLKDVDYALGNLDENCKNDSYPYESTLKVIRELLQRELPIREQILAFGEHLREKLPPDLRGEPLGTAMRNAASPASTEAGIASEIGSTQKHRTR